VQLEVIQQTNQIDMHETVQRLEVTASDLQFTVDETIQQLEILQPVRPQLDLFNNELTLELNPPSINYNIYSDSQPIVAVVAGEDLGGHRAVYVDNGQAFYADHIDVNIPGQVIGVTRNAATAGLEVAVQYTGEMVESGWEFVPGPVYVGAIGALIQNRPAIGWVLKIGTALSPTRLLIEKTMSIEVI